MAEKNVRELAHLIESLVSEVNDHLLGNIRVVEWMPEHGFFDLVTRAAVVRQHEGLDAIAKLVCIERGDAAVALLRPACEEYIVLRYITAIHRDDAENLVRLLARRDLEKALSAQHDFAGADVMRKLGLMDNYKFHVAQRSEVESDLVRLRKKLGWSKRNEVPSVWFMAKHVNEERRYRFLYFATSRAVHFNVHELVRRCWGKPGEIVVDSDHFEEYWARFALSWGLRLYVDVLSLGLQHFHQGSEIDDSVAKRLLGLIEEVGEAGTMPIITAEEMLWP